MGRLSRETLKTLVKLPSPPRSEVVTGDRAVVPGGQPSPREARKWLNHHTHLTPSLPVDSQGGTSDESRLPDPKHN